jgi:diguanylate cyclase (GGDEF)-like protein
MAKPPPDLVLINLSDHFEQCHAFCRKIRATPEAETEAITIVSVGLADNSHARFAALDAGAGDVLPRPISDTLLLARIRSLMRRRNLGRELIMRDGTNRSFRFEDAGPGVISIPIIAVLSHDLAAGHSLMLDLRDKIRGTIRLNPPNEMLDESRTDTVPLTGLYNRRYAETHVLHIAKQAQKLDQVYSVMMVDIDHFKSINYIHGHAAGDRVLKGIADRLRQNFRPIDLVASVGGEKFLIMMPSTVLIGAEAAAQRLRRLANIRALPISSGQEPLPVTVSSGVATGLDLVHDLSFAELFKDADDALYCAKASGRDAVSIAGAAS